MKTYSQTQTNSEILISYKIPTGFQIKAFLFVLLICTPVLSSVLFEAFQKASKTGVVRIECDHVEPKQVNCQISKSKFFGLVKTNTLDYKFVQQSQYDNARFLLMTKFGKKEVFEDIDYQTAYTINNALNSFLGSNQKSFSYNYDERFVFYMWLRLIAHPGLFFCGFILLGAFVLLTYSQEYFFDKPNRLLKHTTKWSLFRTKINHYLFSDVAKIDVLYSSDSYNNVSFITRITINSNNSKLQHRLYYISDRQVAINFANNLNRFIGLPEEEDPVVKQ